MNLENALLNLNSSHTDTIIAALKIIGRSGKLSDLQSIISHVKNPNISIQQAAIQATSTLIRENLITHFHELEAQVREKLGLLLQSLDPSIVDEISKDLYSDSEERRIRTVQILGLLKKNPQLREILAKLIHNREVKIRATAVNLLAKVIGPNDHDLLLSLLNDKDLRVRANTIEALESLKNKRLVPILLRYRKDSNNRIRGNVLKALFSLGYTEVENDLSEMLGSPNHLMQASALWVISKIQPKSQCIEDAVALCLLSEQDLVASNAKKTLASLNSPRAMGYLRYLA